MSWTVDTYVRPFQPSVCRTVAEIQSKIDEGGKRNTFYRVFTARSDKDVILAWRQDLNAVLNIFNVGDIDSISAFADGSFRQS